MKEPAQIIRDAEGRYTTSGPVEPCQIVEAAQAILAERFARGEALTSPAATRRYLIAKLATRESEVFGCLWLDTRHRILSNEDLFAGTIDGASVYPREVIRTALGHNAAAVIFYHNHPSGVPEPSAADRALTRRLVEALKLIEVRTLDHIVVGGAEAVSFAERGLL